MNGLAYVCRAVVSNVIVVSNAWLLFAELIDNYAASRLRPPNVAKLGGYTCHFSNAIE
jgi:hypothetical protein